MKTSFVALAILISQASAIPWKRQSMISMDLSSAIMPPSPTAPAPVEPTMPTSVLTGVEQSSAPSPPEPSPPAPAPAPPSPYVNLAYPCPDGFSLAYVEEQRTYEYNYAELDTFEIIGNWSGVEYWGANNVQPISGGEEIGAFRSRVIPGQVEPVMVNETLVNITTTLDFFQTITNLTSGPIMLDTGSISNWSQVFQTYANETAGENMLTAKIFSNICTSNKTATMESSRFAFRFVLANIQLLLSGEPVPDVSTSGTPMEPAESMPSEPPMPSEPTEMPAEPMESMSAPSMPMESEPVPSLAAPSMSA